MEVNEEAERRETRDPTGLTSWIAAEAARRLERGEQATDELEPIEVRLNTCSSSQGQRLLRGGSSPWWSSSASSS